MNLYKGEFNYHGEVHELYTHAKREYSAFLNFMYQLSEKLEMTKQVLKCYFLDNRTDNWSIEEVTSNTKQGERS